MTLSFSVLLVLVLVTSFTRSCWISMLPGRSPIVDFSVRSHDLPEVYPEISLSSHESDINGSSRLWQQRLSPSLPVFVSKSLMISTAGWTTGPRADYAKLNRLLADELKRSPRDLQNAWGRGGSQGTRAVSVSLLC